MEIAEKGLASGSVRDLPPSKRFKYVGSHLGSNPSVLLPAKKRVFPPPPVAEEAAVSVCLPVKKRPEAHAAVVPVCLPVKKRAIAAAPPPDGAVPVCLPAKKRAYAPPADALSPACLPAKKRVGAPPQPEDVVASSRVLAKKRVHAPAPRDAAGGSVPVCPPANRRACTSPAADTVALTCVVTKKRSPAPGPPQDGARSVPVCLPANKRVMPPPSMESGGARFGAAKEVCAQESSKHGGGAINPGVANGTEGCAGGKEFKKSDPLMNHKGVKEQVSMKPSKARSPRKAKDLDKCRKIVNVKQSQVVAEVRKKSDKAGDGDAKGAALKEESRNRAAEEGEQEAVQEYKKHEKPINPQGTKEQLSKKSRSPSKAKDTEKKACKIVNGKQTEVGVEVPKKSDIVADAKGAAPKEELRNWADEMAQELEQESVEEDDGVLCAVCGSTDGDPSDPIVFCDGCDLMVHASCYGNPLAQAIPDGDWFCSLCSAKSKPAARPSCCLCPARGGAMKRTTEGQWAHISCALFVPEVFFQDPDGRDGVDCSLVPAHRFAKDCYICESNNGCALECSQPKCGLGFHVSCGLDSGLCIEYKEGKGGAIVAGFCREHTELWEKQQLTGKYKIVARGQE